MFIHFEVFWIHLYYFYGDAYIYITNYGRKIFIRRFALLNYFNLYKINVYYIAFITYVTVGNYIHSTFRSFTWKPEIILYIMTCLLSKHIPSKKKIVILKNLDYEALTTTFSTISTFSEIQEESLLIN